MCARTSIKKRLRELREEKELSRAQVSDNTKIPHVTIVSWEYGKKIPTIVNLEKLADYYNVSLDYIAGRTNNPKVCR